MQAPAVAIEGINKSFKANQPVLNGIDLNVKQGEMVGLIGASGSGKSTLIRVIAGFETIDKGQGNVRLFGKECQVAGRRTGAIRELRHDVGIIFQQFNLIGRLTLLLNVLVGRLGRISRLRGTFGLFPQEDRIKALQALERVGIVDMAYQRASTLSGGQQQRAAIARALTQEAKLILADEPIASLDPASAERVMTILRSINQQDKVTVIVSLHQIDHAFKHCDRIIALKDGKIIHDGNVEQITKEDLEDLYGVALADEDNHEIRGAGTKKPGKKAEKRPVYGNGRDPNPQLAAASALDA
ncbi:MAG: phosphonate ABC transporter ATP-binding protein [Rhodospirillales bacterium]|nr:phosphonate ABC transporter ATP-binding protein [Rhodospirillales bacterium]